MRDWKKGLVLFTAMLSPLSLADWQLDIDFELSREGKKHTTKSTVSLVLGEETILFDNNSAYGAFVGKAELLEINAAEIKISLLVQEKMHDGHCRTIMCSTVNANLETQSIFNINNQQRDEVASLKVALMSV